MANRRAAKLLHEGKGAGSDYIGWLDLPEDYDKEEFARIQKAAKKFNLIQKFLLLSVSVVHTSVHVQQLTF